MRSKKTLECSNVLFAFPPFISISPEVLQKGVLIDYSKFTCEHPSGSMISLELLLEHFFPKVPLSLTVSVISAFFSWMALLRPIILIKYQKKRYWKWQPCEIWLCKTRTTVYLVESFIQKTMMVPDRVLVYICQHIEISSKSIVVTID